MFSLEGKKAIITGGGSGIGKAIAKLFGKQGAYVCILDFNEESGRAVVQEIINEGGQATFAFCDVAKPDSVSKAFKDVLGNDSLDILVNNAGVSHIGTVESTTEEDLDRIYQINIKGVYLSTKEAIPYFKTGGAILNLASIASVVGLSERFAYSMSKGAVLTMTLSVAKDYLDKGIRCNCMAPARIHTPFVDGFLNKNYPGREAEMFEALSKTQPIGRMGKPEEVAALALYLCSDEASFITGSCYPIDGGFITLNS
ncbi:SDR family NAD(P)-dependent oxidoreductase [Marinoscillum sp. MHG1-6]|uniref:SDR family NAD(P)-dependent oxidoreductase n=1 Tax=Marinoscillum sp. MHG1-6 TaxID=2959627 RepID=UPI0021580ABA|nr:glucose 1-dehydrogenase [Marinoscillum sp. MHG1-6]